MRCSIQVQALSKPDNATPVIGNLFDEPLGYSTRVVIEAGRYGLPHVTLICRVNKPKEVFNKGKGKALTVDILAQKVSAHSDQYHEFKASWRPGVKVLGQYMMDAMRICQMTTHEAPLHLYNEVIVGQCTKDADKKPVKDLLDKITAITFIGNSARTVGANPKYAAGLPGNVRATFGRVFSNADPIRITIWLRSFPDCVTATHDWGRFLTYQVNNHIPPFSQYIDSHGQTVCHWDATEIIQNFGKGMYNTYRTVEGVEENKSTPQGYYNFPLQRTWQDFIELGVTITMPIVRTVQYQEHRAAYINTTQNLIYVQSIPRVAGKKQVDSNDFCFVRMKRRTHKAKFGISPPLGSAIKLCLDNSSAFKPHITPNSPSEFHYGTVMEDEDGCARTGTDFCIRLRCNRSAAQLETRSDLCDLDDEWLMPAYLTVRVDTAAAERDLVGAIKLADPSYNPDALSRIREAIMQEPDNNKRRWMNLCKRKPVAWEDFKNEQLEACGGNKEQYECITWLEQVVNKFIGVTGPPGTGKTEIAARTMLGSINQGLKILGVAPQNVAVDGIVMKFWKLLPDKHKFGDEEKMFLRLATGSAGMRAYIAVKSHISLTISNSDELQSFNELSTEDAEELTVAWAETVPDWRTYDLQIRQTMKKGATYIEAREEQSRQADRVEDNVPVMMTIGWHIHKAVLEDAENAEISFNIEREVWTGFDVFPEDFINSELAEDQKGLMGTTTLEAFRSERISVQEFEVRIRDGRIKTSDERRRFRNYTALAKLYLKQDRNLSRVERDKLTIEWDRVMATVFARLDGVFTTCNNAGSDLINTAFKPDAIFCDEAGQLGLAAVGNVLTSLSGWEVVYFFGDPQHFPPFDSAGIYNEFRENAKLSAIALFDFKNFNMIRLTVQYRMAPSIVKWVNEFFYENDLVNHESVEADNVYRRIGRNISRGLYGIKGPKGNGSEYWNISVERGISRNRRTNTSLVNHANSDVVVELTGRFLRGGIAPHDIGILTYYVDQKLLNIKLLSQANASGGNVWEVNEIDVDTVDAYQGREIRVGIVDIVVATREADNDPGSYIEGGSLSDHVKDARRLCSALTRSKDILVVVYQASALTLRSDKKRTRQRATLMKMVADAHKRGLIYNDTTHLDTHPDAIDERRAMTAREQALDLEQWNFQKAAYVRHSLPRALKIEMFPTAMEELPVYNTRLGRTRHPTDIDAAAKAAATINDEPVSTL